MAADKHIAGPLSAASRHRSYWLLLPIVCLASAYAAFDLELRRAEDSFRDAASRIHAEVVRLVGSANFVLTSLVADLGLWTDHR